MGKNAADVFGAHYRVVQAFFNTGDPLLFATEKQSAQLS
jgi:hypothetical protein